jgi:hypothetical protein
MKKITIILAVLLVISLGAGIYFFVSAQNLKADLNASRNENAALEAKISKSLAYAETFDILMWGGWKAAGITPRFQFDNDTAALLELKNRIKNLNDSELATYEQDLEKTGSQTAVFQTMDYLLGVIQKSLK